MLTRLLSMTVVLWVAISVPGCVPTATSPPADAAGGATQRTAVLVPGTGTYSRPISNMSAEAQRFFDQGLRLAWGFYFPEAIASHQQAARLAPGHPMPYWGMAHAMGPQSQQPLRAIAR